MDRSTRFALFIAQMEASPGAATFEEARRLLETVLNRVEDQHSGVPFDPDAWQQDGRFYPPANDSEKKSGIADVRMFRTRAHRVWIAANGAIRITAVAPPGRVVFEKPGADGGCCPAS